MGTRKANPLKKKEKKKKKKQVQQSTFVVLDLNDESGGAENGVEAENGTSTSGVEIEYVAEAPSLDVFSENNVVLEEFKHIFERFTAAPSNEEQQQEEQQQNGAKEGQSESSKKEGETGEGEHKALSKKQKKRLKRPSIATLKSKVSRPDIVEAWDVTASDPLFLIHLKGVRNSVHVPRHWNQKRKYLQGKRGIEKPPFQLPEFIAATGISRIRQAVAEKEAAKGLKQKQRDRMNPKMGRLDIDYQVLHDAFFKYQTKPKLTIHGDLYYEGKEFEITLKEKRPGKLSEELKKALGMPEGAPPPWLINMQRYGPPPSYPNLKIPGVNSPIPEGARYGFHPGGWGKPPVDEFNRPLYGDVFGQQQMVMGDNTQPIERTHWGEMQEEEEEEEEEEEVEGQAEEEQNVSGMETPSGFETPSGMVTPESLDLRRGPSKPAQRPQEAEEDDSRKQLYQVIPEEKKAVGMSLYGSEKAYVIPPSAKREMKNAQHAVNIIKSQKTEPVDISLAPEEVEHLEELNADVLKEKMENKLAEKHRAKEDVSDLMAEHEAKQAMKRKKEQDRDSKSKKHKGFKF